LGGAADATSATVSAAAATLASNNIDLISLPPEKNCHNPIPA